MMPLLMLNINEYVEHEPRLLVSQVIRDFMRQYVEMNGGGLQLELFNDSASFKLVNK